MPKTKPRRDVFIVSSFIGMSGRPLRRADRNAAEHAAAAIVAAGHCPCSWARPTAVFASAALPAAAFVYRH
jgi:hypothetical protein